MIQRALYHVAGVDRQTLATCPATDKVWAAHLGFSLCLSFIVVLGVAFHATGYMITDPSVRALASLVIALTVFMFDRALYQSDWFYQGLLWQPGSKGDASGGWPARRFLRIGIRLAMSFGLAWVIAVFLELAIFSDTISDKIKGDHVAANQPVYQKIEQYQAEVGAEVEQRRKALAALEALYRDELAGAAVTDAPEPALLADLEQQIKALDAQESALRAGLREIQEQIKSYAADMNAEQLGQRLNASNSGRAGAGPRYQFARQQKEVYEAQHAARDNEIAQLRVKRDDLRATQTRIAADAAARRSQARTAIQGKRDAIQVQIEDARAGLKELDLSRLARVEDFRQKTLAASDFRKQKDDPLARMTAYQELKNDPKDGATITLFSWMTKFLIIFLEIVPVVAKLFFSPPSVYAMRIQAGVEHERRRIRRDLDPAAEPEAQIERRMEDIASRIRVDAAARRERAVSVAPFAAASSGAGADLSASGPPLVPPPVGAARPRNVEPKPQPVRTAAAERRGLGAERRRDIDPPLNEETTRHPEMRAEGRRGPAPAPRREPRELAELGFLLQDDIPQKP
jgi:hypothetical protein